MKKVYVEKLVNGVVFLEEDTITVPKFRPGMLVQYYSDESPYEPIKATVMMVTTTLSLSGSRVAYQVLVPNSGVHVVEEIDLI